MPPNIFLFSTLDLAHCKKFLQVVFACVDCILHLSILGLASIPNSFNPGWVEAAHGENCCEVRPWRQVLRDEL